MAAEVAKHAARQLPNFKLGTKQVFLPEHVITFLRKDHQPPNEACFQVPLRFTKFDLRDYLWNVYNVETTKVRSYVKQEPLAQRPNTRNSWYRPQAKKIMVVELTKPFQWPDVPSDLEPWHKSMFDDREAAIEKQKQQQKTMHSMTLPLKSREPWGVERESLHKLAQQTLSGEVPWTNDVKLDPKWDAILAEAEGKSVNREAKKLKEEPKKEAQSEGGVTKEDPSR